METIHFTSDVAATFSCADCFPLEELLAQAFNWKAAVSPVQTKSSLAGGAEWVQKGKSGTGRLLRDSLGLKTGWTGLKFGCGSGHRGHMVQCHPWVITALQRAGFHLHSTESIPCSEPSFCFCAWLYTAQAVFYSGEKKETELYQSSICLPQPFRLQALHGSDHVYV